MLSRLKVNPYVFFISAGVVVAFVLVGAVFSGPVERAFGAMQAFIVTQFGWFYTLAVAAFLIFVLWLMFSRFGAVRLGKDDEKPEYSYVTWFAMLFSAGMGIGLLFYGVAEPILHFGNPPNATPGTAAAAREAINLTFFHWGMHAWAVYIVVGLSLAYFAYRHDLPLTIRSTLYPLLGRRIHGPIGDVIDLLAVFGTVFGLATSLGLGVMQINAGLQHLGLMGVSTQNQLILIAVITFAATISVVTGVNVGIRRLSELNLGLATLLLLFVFVMGPTFFLLSSFVQSVGNYASSLVQMTFRTDAFVGVEWQKKWTMFYWGWWISWSPFVGMFIARVSRGRTIREFVSGVLLVPTLITFFWMTVFGNTAIHLELFGGGGMVEAVNKSVPTAIFVMLEKLPLTSISATVTVLVVAVFFVTSSDSGSLVVDILTSGGHPDPPIAQRVFWATMEGLVAGILLVTGGLVALRAAALTTALPFSMIMVLICVSLFKGLRAERTTPDRIDEMWENLRRLPASVRRRVVGAPPAGATRSGTYDGTRQAAVPKAGDPAAEWRQELAQMVSRHEAHRSLTTDQRREFLAVLEESIDAIVMPAFQELEKELERHGREVEIDREGDTVRLTVLVDGVEELSYVVQGRQRDPKMLAFPKMRGGGRSFKGRVEVILRSGKRMEYVTDSLTREGIIRDFLASYDKWMGW